MIDDVQIDPASFRDPRGHVYHFQDKIYRSVAAAAVEDFEFMEQNKFYEILIVENKLLGMEVVHLPDCKTWAPEAAYILEHPKVPYISYPYEWPFHMLKAAALLQLQIHLQALNFGVTLLDSSAYNIQFIGSKPIFIDHLAFTRYQDGMIWLGYRQFCEQFLVPLLLMSYCHVVPNAWYRGNLDGIKINDLAKLLPWYRKLNPKVFFHICLHASLQKTTVKEAKKAVAKVNLPLNSLKNLLQSLYDWIAKLQFASESISPWQDYPEQQKNTADKEAFITSFIQHVKPKLLYDLGCNSGKYALLASHVGAEYVVGFDGDIGSIERAAVSAAENKTFLPLYMDLANPSPSQGWNQAERIGMKQRAKADALLALAIVHHLVIANNVPLEKVIRWVVQTAPNGVIEFVPKADPMLQMMLQSREDIFSDYTFTNFLKYLKRFAEIVRIAQVSESGRVLVWYRIGNKE